MIAAIDPGTTESAYVEWDGEKISAARIMPNETILSWLGAKKQRTDVLTIEAVKSYGMAIGQTTIDTIFWSGRFAQEWYSSGGTFDMVPRIDVKMHLCHRSNAKDGNVIQALKDRFGEKGTKKSPGLTYNLASHKWQAFALAVYWWDTNNNN